MNEKSGKAKASAQARWKKSSDANAMRSSMRTQCERIENNANASNLDANAMRNGCERNAPNTQYPRTQKPKKKKNAGNVFRVRHSPVFHHADGLEP